MRTRLLRTALAVSVLLLGWAPRPLSAQDWKGRARVHGSVKDEDGHPVASARVILAWADSNKGPTLSADAKGSWAIGGLRGGTWNIDVEAAGFETRRLSVALDEQGAGPTIDVKLRRAQGGAAATSPGGASDPRSGELKEALRRGDAEIQAGHYAEARAEYEKVAAEKPELVEVQRSIAFCHYREGHLEASIEKLRVILEKDPASQDTLLLLANILLEKGDLEPALEALAKVDESKVVDGATFLNIGILLLNKQKPEEAIRYLDKTLALDSSHPEAYYYRGLARLQAKDVAAAKADFGKFLALRPDAPEAAAATEALKSLK